MYVSLKIKYCIGIMPTKRRRVSKKSPPLYKQYCSQFSLKKAIPTTTPALVLPLLPRKEGRRKNFQLASYDVEFNTNQYYKSRDGSHDIWVFKPNTALGPLHRQSAFQPFNPRR
mmetsp:Transcript_26301/g.29285  ORF Transcript_26301/g.29285 Transcript_26301/m.29285 type:complete len:114 (+) Transcript_26301:278-619(+)